MDKIEELNKLKSLLDQGAITEQEYQVLKKDLIEDLHSNSDVLNSTSNAKSDPIQLSRKKIKLTLYFGMVVLIAFLGYNILSPKLGIMNVEHANHSDNIDDTAKITQDNNTVYEGGVEVGKIVKFEVIITTKKRGRVFKIPEGKMWTPLYFDFENLNHNYSVSVPEILTKKYNGNSCGKEWYYDNIYDDLSTNTWWYKGSGPRFPERDDFISIKVCKRNRKALTGMNAIMVEYYSTNVRYILYFLEEAF